jgi:hypothetical protein
MVSTTKRLQIIKRVLHDMTLYDVASISRVTRWPVIHLLQTSQ